jgi:signal transduction histidine kinase
MRCWKGGNPYQLYEWSGIALNNRIYLTGRNVDTEYQHREEIAKAMQELQARNEDLERFASVAAHQLRSPPRTIAGIADALQEDYGHLLDAEALTYLSDIQSDADQMAEIVDGLYRFSKVQTLDDLKCEPVDLNKIMTLVQEHRGRLRCDECPSKGHCPYANKAPYKCPNKRESILYSDLPVVLGDKILLKEVLTNLIDNGFKFNESEHKVIQVSTTQKEDDPDRYLIHVKDNGIGINPQYHNKLFQMFQRMHPQYKGTGVGLALVSAIVRKFGGSITVSSAKGAGTRFSFDLKKA